MRLFRRKSTIEKILDTCQELRKLESEMDQLRLDLQAKVLFGTASALKERRLKLLSLACDASRETVVLMEAKYNLKAEDASSS